MDVHGRAVPVEPELEHPLRRRRPGLVADFPLRLPSFLVGDPPAGALEILFLDAFEEAQEVEAGWLVVHAFDSMMAGVDNNLSPGRYHLLLSSGGQPVQHGWWSSEETGEELAGWPDSPGVVSGPA